MTDSASETMRRGAMQRFLDIVEVVGNKLPHPTMMFIALIGIVLAVAALLSGAGVVVDTATGSYPINNLIGNGTVDLQNPRNGEVMASYSSGWNYLLSTLTPNFTGFAPFGMVLVIMIAIGVAEHGGLIGTAMRKLVLSAPTRLIAPTVIFAGVISNIAADAGYLVMIPLGPIVFMSVGRHPLAGLAAAFAGVSGGFSANLVVSSLDPLLGGFTQAAAATGDGLLGTNFAETMNIATMNYYFLVVSTFLVVGVGTIVVEWIVEPHLGTYDTTNAPLDEQMPDEPSRITDDEARGLRVAGIVFLAYAALVVWMTVPVKSAIPLLGVLSTASLPVEALAAIEARYGGVGVTHAPLFETQIIVSVLFFMFLLPGLGYGIASGKFRSGDDFVASMENSVRLMVSFIVLVFFMAQFVAYFNASNIGVLLAMQGAELLELVPTDTGVGFTGLIFGFVFLAGFINLFMGSASAKWAILAPIFVPVMMTVDITPAATQMLYRIGDSSTNVITPLMTYFAFVMAVGGKYSPNFGIGSLASLMIPISIAFMLSWTLLFLIWAFAGLPLGPGSPVFFAPPIVN
ncbi:MAG: AbgT family transporter [Pseudomonadota bacterium]